MGKVTTSYRISEKKLQVYIAGGGSAYIKPDEAIEIAAGMLTWAMRIKADNRIDRAAKKWKVSPNTVRNLKGR
jgi:hypothetical protein